MQNFVVIGYVYFKLEHSKFGWIFILIEILFVGRAPGYPWNLLPSGELILTSVSTPTPSSYLISTILLGKSLVSLSSWGCLSAPSPHCSWEAFEVPSVVVAALALSRAGVHPRSWGAHLDRMPGSNGVAYYERKSIDVCWWSSRHSDDKTFVS